MGTFKVFNNHIKISFALLAVCETVLYFSSIYIAIAFRFTTLDFNSPELYNSIGNVPFKALIFTVLHMLSMTALGLYQVEQFRGRTGFLQMVSRIIVSMFLVAVVLMVIYYLLPYTQIGRGVTALAFLISAILIILARRTFFAIVDPNSFMS